MRRETLGNLIHISDCEPEAGTVYNSELTTGVLINCFNSNKYRNFQLPVSWLSPILS